VKYILVGVLLWGSVQILSAADLVKNGSFEEFTVLKGNQNWKIVTLKEWKTNYSLKVWTNKKVEAIDGLYKLELDSNKGVIDEISQEIITRPNQNYRVCLYAYARRNKTSDFQILIDDEVLLDVSPTKEWQKYCVKFTAKSTNTTLTLKEVEGQDNGSGAMLDRVRVKEIRESKTKEEILQELSTQVYKTEWFDKAKDKWNLEHPENPYIYEYYTYTFPTDADFEAGNPPDASILPDEWMKSAGLGFSKFLKYPFEDSKYQYNDAQVKEWKNKGFRNGRLHVPLYAMVDLEKDPTGATLKEKDLETIKNICQIFVDNDMPITVSIVSGDELSDNMKDDRSETFRRTIEWWRQLSSYFKDMSYLVAFENYVEYHGFDDIAIEKKDFKVELDNGETHYSGFKNYKNREITNWVRTPGYNNLMAEIAKVVRVTNPKRIFIYKPNGIGRSGLVNITPWRWGSEGDYLGINNTRTPYWLISCGGSANIKFDYIKAIRSENQEEKEALLQSARVDSWGPAIDYYNATKTPVWISLFGIKADLDKVDSELNGVDITTDEIVSYISWYQTHIQNDAVDAAGNHVKVPSGFQQTPWIWDFKNQTWFEGTLNDRWENFEKVWQTLSKYTK